MLGVVVNTVAVIIGSLIGTLCKKGIPHRLSSAIMIGIGLCTIYIGIDGMLCDSEPIVAIVSLVIGALIGTLLNIDFRLNRVGERLSAKLAKNGENRLAEGFVTATLLFCVGAMAIVGSLSAGLHGDNSMLYTKSVLDFTSSLMLSSTFGIGVMLAAIPLTVYQGVICLASGFLEPFLSGGAIAAISCVGSIIIMGLGFNLVGISKLKIADYLPAILVAPFIFYLFDFLM